MDGPIRWSDGALELLDQTRLPVEQRWIRCESPEDVAGAIRRLAVRGAPLIGLAAAYGVALGMRTAAADESAHARFAAVAPVLDSSRPTAANLAWALERARELVEQRDGATARELADPLLQLADRLASEQREADGRMAELGARLLHVVRPLGRLSCTQSHNGRSTLGLVLPAERRTTDVQLTAAHRAVGRYLLTGER